MSVRRSSSSCTLRKADGSSEGDTPRIFTTLPATMAWNAFGEKDGAASFPAMAGGIKRYRADFDLFTDEIGCYALTEPFFLPRERWVPAPANWRGPTQVGKRYETTEVEGAALWQQVADAIPFATEQLTLPGVAAIAAPAGPRYGTPALRPVRLGQGTFRTIIDAYERRCVVTNERTLPVLEAAHIKPYSELGPHALDNGLLLRSDLHTLFDQGFMTVTPDLKVHVSGEIRLKFENGRD
jgi:putative restriction endonuclease